MQAARQAGIQSDGQDRSGTDERGVLVVYKVVNVYISFLPNRKFAKTCDFITFKSASTRAPESTQQTDKQESKSDASMII